MKEKLNSYQLSKDWFNFCFENPEKINPNHTALYFFIVEHCNRLAWKTKFGLPTTMAKEAIGVKSYNTYIKTLNDLIDFGFIKLIEKSKNQYSSNIVALLKNDKAHDNALDKAMLNHSAKQSESTIQSIDSIIKLITNNLITIKPITRTKREIILNFINSIPLKDESNETWRNNFEIYKTELNDWFENIKTDLDYLDEQQRFNPGIDVLLSIEKSIKVFWGTEAGWKNKKKNKTVNIDWKSTIAKNIDKNRVYKNESNRTNNKNGFNSPETAATIESIKRQFEEVEQARISAETLSDFD